MNKSFTLIEILVVIVVIGVLSAFILVGMSSISNSANIAKTKAFLNSMDNSMLLGRVSQWKLDESSGTTANDSWGANNGTILGTPLIQTTGCPSNNCLYFDGSNDYVSIGDSTSFDLTTTVSIGCWIKNETASLGGIITKGLINDPLEFGLSFGYSPLLLVARPKHYSTQVTYPWDGKFLFGWHYILMSIGGDGTKLYIDGQIVNQSANTLIANNSEPLLLGLQWTYYVRGSMDDVRMYNQAIPTSEIQQNYFVGINNLFKNNGIALNEFNQRIGELRNNLAKD